MTVPEPPEKAWNDDSLDVAQTPQIQMPTGQAIPSMSAVSTFSHRLAGLSQDGKRTRRWFIPSESVFALLVDLPVRGQRQRAAALTFAAEDRIGASVESVIVAQAPLRPPTATPTQVLAVVVSRAVLATASVSAPPDAAILPDFMAIPRPADVPGGIVWAVWCDGPRTVVRVSDGTGFGVATGTLPILWNRAGRPAIRSLGDGLPDGLAGTDMSAAPPPADIADLAFTLRRDGATGPGQAAMRPFKAALVVLAAGLILHLAITAVDLFALNRIAAQERATAQAAVAAVLPGIDIGTDPAAILARLAPRAAPSQGSDFLPLLSEVSAILAASGPSVTLRRLTYGASDGVLSLQVQAGGLDDLQQVEQVLQAAGLIVTSGAANAGDGGAEVELHIARGAE